MKKSFIMDGRLASQGAVDFSYLLDAPAGKYGFVQAADGQFKFSNGKRIRFFGTNLSAGAVTPDKEAAVLMAERLSKSGVNMVRLHFADRYSDGSLIDYSKGDSRSLDPESLDRLDFLVSELKKRGIYIQIDLFVVRSFLPGDDLDYPDPLIWHWPIKQINVFNQRLIELQKEYAEQYLLHVNPYTGLRYVDEPAVAVVEVMNENSIFWSLDDPKSAPSYVKELDGRWNEWLVVKYGSREVLDAAWTREDGVKGLLKNEDPKKGTVLRPSHGGGGQPAIDYNADYQGVGSPARYADHIEFLMEIQLDFSKEMKDHLLALGVKCPVNISNHAKGAGDTYAISLYSDVMENNGYWNHPLIALNPRRFVFHPMEMHSSDPRVVDGLGQYKMNLITRLSLNTVKDKPFIISEWNSCYPTKFRSDAMLMMAAYGALQDWDGMLLYSYSHFSSMKDMKGDRLSSFWNIYNDPATWGQLGLCAAIFNGEMIHPAVNSIDLCYTPNDMKMMPENWIAPFGVIPYISKVRTCFISERYNGSADAAVSSGFGPTGDFRDAKHALVYARSPYADGHQKHRRKDEFLKMHRDEDGAEGLLGIGEIGEKSAVIWGEEAIDEDYICYSSIFDTCMKKWNLVDESYGLQESSMLVSDTGELVYDFGKGAFCIKTPKVVSYAGAIKGVISMDRFKFNIHNSKMAVTVLPRDGKGIRNSKHLLMVAAGESGNTEMQWDGNVLVSEGEAPVWIDQIDGSMSLQGTYAACSAYALSPQGSRREELSVEINEDGITIFFDNTTGTMYYEIVLE